jgi:hypothetical protein
LHLKKQHQAHNATQDQKSDKGSTTPEPVATTAKIKEIDAWCAHITPHITTAAAKSESNDLIIFDSGASDHMTPKRQHLLDYRSITPIQINAASKTIFHGIGKGIMKVKIANKSEDLLTLELKNTIYAPDMSATLILLSQLEKEGYKITLFKGKMTIQDPEERICAIIP